jgi:hypothetical protein
VSSQGYAHIGCPLANFLEFEVTSWSKPLVQRSPLWLILTIFLWGIFLYPVVTHSPIDYFALFGYLTSFAFILMLQIKALARERNTPT